MSLTPTDIEVAVLTANVVTLRARSRVLKRYSFTVPKQKEALDIDRQIEYMEEHIQVLRGIAKKKGTR